MQEMTIVAATKLSIDFKGLPHDRMPYSRQPGYLKETRGFPSSPRGEFGLDMNSILSKLKRRVN
jgi:hypothetical protein